MATATLLREETHRVVGGEKCLQKSDIHLQRLPLVLTGVIPEGMHPKIETPAILLQFLCLGRNPL